MPQSELRLRIVVLRPPKGVTFAVQCGREKLVPPVHTTSAEQAFEVSVRVAEGKDGRPNFLGPFAQGPAGQRFVYVNSGRYANEAALPWNRRAKVHLRGIDWPLVREAQARGAALEARIEGTARDGGPACATVPLLDGGWRLVT
jgi:hypothetical protein